MNRESISKAVGGISDRHVTAAASYDPAGVSGGPERIEPMKTRTHHRAGTIAIIIAACLALSGIAYASGAFRQNYNWKGEPVGAPYSAELPPDAEIVFLNTEEEARTVAAILDDRADRELVIVRDAEGSQTSHRSESVGSIGELREKLAAEDSPLRAPFAIPEGYVLADGYVSYDATGGYFRESAEERPDGLVVERYTAPPENDFISFYRLDYENAAGDWIFIFAQMSEDSNHSFSASDGATVKAVAVAGMDEALLQQSGRTATVDMLDYLEEPITCFDAGWLSYKVKPEEQTKTYTEVYYMCSANNMGAEELMEMLGA